MPRWKQWTRRAFALLAFVATVVAALVAALLAPYVLAAQSANITVLTLSSVASFALVAWIGLSGVALAWGSSAVRRPATMLSGVLSAVFLGGLYLTVLRSSASRIPAVTPYENTKYWELPTGSKIAYSEFDPPPGVRVRPEAVVYLHGGPGARQALFDQETYGGLSAQGFSVFLFDQAGSGLSDFLPHVRDYTMRRSVQDLEAVRERIGAGKMILIGHSWGSTLAASYMAKYPDRVAKVVFHSPGRLWNLQDEDVDYSRTASPGPSLPASRFLAALLLRERSPEAAENLVSQGEAEMLGVPSLRETLGTVVCAGDIGALPREVVAIVAGQENPGFNPYVTQELISGTSRPQDDPHAALRSNHTPAMLLFPECNYVSWTGAIDYRSTLPDLKIYYVPRAGHYIQFEQPQLLTRAITAFVLDQPDVIPPYKADADPRSRPAQH